jgi:hypothetical protein
LLPFRSMWTTFLRSVGFPMAQFSSPPGGAIFRRAESVISTYGVN